MGNKKYYSKNKITNKVRKVFNNPWLDKKCSILINKRKVSYKKIDKKLSIQRI